jgi:hypothetical protein
MKSGCVRNGKYSGINFRLLQFQTGKTIHTTVKQPNRQGHNSTQHKSKFRGPNEEKLDASDVRLLKVL